MNKKQEHSDTNYPKITVVTPNYNQGDFIEQTLCSVLDQGYPNLEYIVIDGGSTDNSVDIIKKYQDRLTYWVSEKDKGMYDAINKGFAKSTGEIMCWINSDDTHRERSLFKVAALFLANPKVEWLMGYPTLINEQGDVTWQGQDAQVHSPYFFYLHNHARSFSFIQQESTFWRRSLWQKANGAIDEQYSLAGDFDLWMRFFKHAKLYFTKEELSAFRRREGQKSEDTANYLAQANLSVKNNQKKLSFGAKTTIFGLKTVRKSLFLPKSKILKKWFYSIQKGIFSTPNWVD